MNKLFRYFAMSYKLSSLYGSEFYEIVSELYNSPEVQSMRQYMQHSETDRLQHMLSVSFLSYNICKSLGLDYVTAARGAMLHDLVYYDWHEGDTGAWHHMHGFHHPSRAALNAKELCGSLNKKEKDIIIKHMWPLTVKPPLYKESFVVTFCDKYCASTEMRLGKNAAFRESFYNYVKDL